jgi:hypothetical protein
LFVDASHRADWDIPLWVWHYHVAMRYRMDKFIMRSANGHLLKTIAEKPIDNIAAVAQQRALLDIGSG